MIVTMITFLFAQQKAKLQVFPLNADEGFCLLTLKCISIGKVKDSVISLPKGIQANLSQIYYVAFFVILVNVVFVMSTDLVTFCFAYERNEY